MSAVTVWRGLRYARLDHRFAAPRLQPLANRPVPGGEAGAAPWQPPVPGLDLGAPQGDDSLNLQVWAPAGAVGLPVLWWLYGGGFEVGAASAPSMDAAALAASVPCVVVAPNYRVGVYGFAELAWLGGGLAEAHDLGLQDAIAAYRWTRENAAVFGGDPARVTVAGQSSGGFLACAVAVSPAVAPPAGLACFSGGASRIVEPEVARRLSKALLRDLGVEDDPERILTLDPRRVVTAPARVVARDIGVRNGPVVRSLGIVRDRAGVVPVVVPRHPMDAVDAGALRRTAVLSSATAEESAGFPPDAVGAGSVAEVADEARRFGGDRADDLVREYAPAGADPAAARGRLLTDVVYRLPAARLVAQQRRAGGRAGLLEVGRFGEAPAAHGTELPALFAHPGDPGPDAPVHDALRRLVRDGEVPAGPRRAGASPTAALAPGRLVELWEGVARP
ncbi:MAG: carboxylesterase family protein [Microbacterium sp.]